MPITSGGTGANDLATAKTNLEIPDKASQGEADAGTNDDKYITPLKLDGRTGVDIGDIVKLEDVGGGAALPAVDGSQLLNLSAGGGGVPDVIIEDQKPNGTNGGNSVSGYQTRNSNTILINKIGVTLAADLITLQAGTYYITARAPMYNSVGTGRLSIYDYTNNLYLITGENASSFGASAVQVICHVAGEITIASAIEIGLRHYIESSETGGLGTIVNDDIGTEIYSHIEITQVN